MYKGYLCIILHAHLPYIRHPEYDYLLRERYKRYVERLIELSEKEGHRTKGDIHFEPIVKMYNQRFRRIKYLFEDVYKRDLTSAFKALQDTGRIEIITSTATHAFLPNLLIYPQAVRAQIKIAKEHFKKNFNRFPKGIWPPECGYAPGIDRYLREEGIKFFLKCSLAILI